MPSSRKDIGEKNVVVGSLGNTDNYEMGEENWKERARVKKKETFGVTGVNGEGFKMRVNIVKILPT